MQPLPRQATPPRLAAGQARLTDVADLLPSAVESDALVTDQHVGRLHLDQHGSEFVELVSLDVGGGTLADSDWYRTTWVDVALQGVDAANARFTESGHKRIAWRQCRMTGFAASGCTLQDTAHEGCLLAMVNYRFASLQRVTFTDCDLGGADFTNARLTDVTFRGCRLTGATFSHAECQRVLFSGGDLVGLTGLDGLRGASFEVDDVAAIAQEMAVALGFRLVER